MRRGRIISAAGTTALVAAATLALMGIVSFMSQIHQGWSPTGTDRGASRAAPPSATVSAPAAAPSTAENRTGSTPAPGGASPGTIATPATGPSLTAGMPLAAERAVEQLKKRSLTIPVAGMEPRALPPSSFTQARGARVHEALDIMAAAGTPVLAVEDGTVAKLFRSDAGGLTVYHFDPSRSVAYYYAHLQGYAEGLAEGVEIKRGQVIGYVGSTGNARPDAPHLHFAIFVLGPEKRWWEGTPIDPSLVLR